MRCKYLLEPGSIAYKRLKSLKITMTYMIIDTLQIHAQVYLMEMLWRLMQMARRCYYMRCRRLYCALLGVLKISWTPCELRENASWCDRGNSQSHDCFSPGFGSTSSFRFYGRFSNAFLVTKFCGQFFWKLDIFSFSQPCFWRFG